MSRGSALVDTLVAAFVTALLLQVAAGAAHLQAAGEQVQEAAVAAAAWTARHGDRAGGLTLAQALAPDADSVALRFVPEGVSVVIRRRVPLIGPGGEVAPLVVGRAVVGVSPYRSRRE
ncbi:MAG: hypothetical protein FJW79_02795 [Actinobacteria bacterium]|nr:hypothetical protein [Actinomycetota bacterium]